MQKLNKSNGPFSSIWSIFDCGLIRIGDNKFIHIRSDSSKERCILRVLELGPVICSEGLWRQPSSLPSQSHLITDIDFRCLSEEVKTPTEITALGQ